MKENCIKLKYGENVDMYNVIMTDLILKCKVVIWGLRQPLLHSRRVAELKAFEYQLPHQFIFANTHYLAYKNSVQHIDELAEDVQGVYKW
jgi:hypothetical protein